MEIWELERSFNELGTGRRSVEGMHFSVCRGIVC